MTIGNVDTNTKSGSVVTLQVDPAPLFFLSPQTGELIVVPADQSALVIQEIVSLDKTFSDLIAGREAVGAAQKALWATPAVDPSKVKAAEQKLDQALKAEEAARKKVAEDLHKIPALNKGAGLLELLPLKGKGPNNLPRGFKMTYVRPEKIKSHLRRYPLSEKDKPGMKSFLTKDASGAYKIDGEKLKESLGKVKMKLPKIEKDLFDPIQKEWMPDFVKGFNDVAVFSKAAGPDDLTEFSGGVVLLRAFAGCSATRTLEYPKFTDILQLKGEVKASLSGKAEIGGSLVEGKLNGKLFLPFQSGLELQLPATKAPYSLGHFRLLIDAGLQGACGASLLAEGGVEVSISADGKQQLQGRPIPRGAKEMRLPRMNVKTNIKPGNELKAELSAFAGASAGASIKGAFQWQKPESTEFGDFAEITPSVDGLAGAGATAAFNIRFSDGMFRVFLKLAACVGLGLKGQIEAGVGAGTIWEFACWFKHQVYLARDEYLGYFEEKAFKLFCAMYTIALVDGKKMQNYMVLSVTQIYEELDDWIVNRPLEFIYAIQQNADLLFNSLAEIKGYIARALSNIAKIHKNLKDDVSRTLHYLFSGVQLKNEFNNVFQHMSLTFGEKTDAQMAKNEVAGYVGSRVLDSVYAELKSEPTPGFDFKFNNSRAYAMQTGTAAAWRRGDVLDDGMSMMA